RLPLADADPDRGGPLVAVARRRHDPVQGGGVGVDAERGADPAGLGEPGRAEPRLREARDARAVREAAGGRAGRLPLRAARERARDRRLRGDRDAAHDLVPEPDLRVPVRRILLFFAVVYTTRWFLRKLASYAGNRWLPPGPPPRESVRPPGWMPGTFRER